jgi:hypothetical protein
MRKLLLLLTSHAVTLLVGIGLGVFLLPILIAPPSPTEAELQTLGQTAQYKGTFKRDLKDSDPLHWGEGEVSVNSNTITLLGRLAPGPDYKLYLSPTFVETEADFNRLKSTMVRVGDVRTFENFVVPVPTVIDIHQYTTVVVWCETFGQFITAAQYRP